VTPERALARIEKLLALAGPASGAAEEERRTAAVEAVRLMAEHGLTPGQADAIDLDEVAALALHAAKLERVLAAERVVHASQLRERDEQWRRMVEQVRRDERAASRKAVAAAAKNGAVQQRQMQARAGARARDAKLDGERKREIARAAALARWARWRERRGVAPAFQAPIGARARPR
jgi:hypothetical protein